MSRILLSLLAAFALGAGAQQRAEQTVLRTEQELKISLDLPGQPTAECQAESSVTYYQRNTLAHVENAIKVADCTLASGEFSVTVRIRGDDGVINMLEFMEAWQRADDKDVSFKADYPIGENVELLSARVRGLTCTCADPPAED
jgi:hypothetical protein